MRTFIFAVVAAFVLVGGTLAFLTLKEVNQRERAAQELIAPEREEDGGIAGPASDDDDAGQDAADAAVADLRWNVGFGDDPADAWVEVERIPQDGKDGHLFGRPGTEARLVVVVMGPSVDDPAIEIIEKLWDGTQQLGFTTTAIGMVSYGDHTWVGYQHHGTVEGVQKTGMVYASIDTTARGAKLLVLGLWPDTVNDAESAAFHRALEHVTVQRQE